MSDIPRSHARGGPDKETGSHPSADLVLTGANELSGGTPAYARKQVTWTAGTADGSVPGNEIEFDVPPGPVRYLVCWSAQTGGTWEVVETARQQRPRLPRTAGRPSPARKMMKR